MRSEIRVMIVEEDSFAIQWMAQLLARDWRTQVICETGNLPEAVNFLQNIRGPLDLVLLDGDFATPDLFSKICAALKDHPKTKVLVVGNIPAPEVWKAVCDEPCVVGYVIKAEIRYSLAWAADFATDGHWVATPGVREIVYEQCSRLPADSLVLDGRHPIHNFTGREAEAARLALIFSMGRHDMSDELSIGDEWSYGLVGAIYKKLGFEDTQFIEHDLVAYFGNHPILLERAQSILQKLRYSKKAKDMEALAFHLLTRPDILY